MSDTTGHTPEGVQWAIDLYSKSPGAVLGSWLMALLAVTYFLGLLSSQTVTYFSAFPRDPIHLKNLVIMVVILSCAQWAVVFAAAWQWFVSHYGDWSTVVAIPWPVCAEPVISQFTVFFAQLFFAYRCFILTGRSKIVLFGLGIAMLASLALFTFVGALLAYDPYNVKVDREVSIPALVINLCTDTAIAGLSTYALMTSVDSGLNPNTNTALNKLIAITWEAAIPPVIAAAINIAVWVTMSDHNIIYTFFHILIPRLYVFSLMFTLNSRISLRRALNAATPTNVIDTSRGSGEPKSLDPKRTMSTINFAPTGVRTTIGTLGTMQETVSVPPPEKTSEFEVDLDQYEKTHSTGYISSRTESTKVVTTSIGESSAEDGQQNGM